MKAKIIIPIAQLGQRLIYGVTFVPIIKVWELFILDVEKCTLTDISLADAMQYVEDNQGEIRKQFESQKIW